MTGPGTSQMAVAVSEAGGGLLPCARLSPDQARTMRGRELLSLSKEKYERA
jgi:hypothetical protein